MKSKNTILGLPPYVYWSGSALSALVTRNWWHKGQLGSDWYAAGALLTAYFSVKGLFNGFKARDQQGDLRRIQEGLAKVSDQFGKAKWATNKDTAAAGLERDGGLVLGDLNGKMLNYHGPGSLITCAPPRSGKGVSLVIPNLLTYRGSVIVLDPKAELYFTTARHRKEVLGQRVIALCPWADKFGSEFGIPIRDNPFNPLSCLKRGPDVKDDCDMIASLLLPGKQTASETEDFWLQSGKDILVGTMLHKISRDGKVTLPALRQALYLTAPETAVLLAEMAQNTDFAGAISEYGKKLSSVFGAAPKQWQGQVATAQKALSIYDSFSPLGRHTADGEIDWQSLKEDPTTIYLMIPSDRLGSHSAWLNLVLSVAIEMVARNRTDKKVLFLMDEFANLGVMPSVLRALTLYPGQGVQIWAVIQELAQLERLYGKDGLQQFLGAASVINSFNTNDYNTAKIFSDWIGERTFRDMGVTTGTDPADQSAKTSMGYSDKGGCLIRPEEIRMMAPDEQIILTRNVPPIRARKIKYYEHPDMRDLADANPYVTI
jgi:type IV secretion system protein VirD4